MEDLKAALRPDTVLVSMMLVNNELGTLQPVAGGGQGHPRPAAPALLHCDAVQGFLKVPFTPKELGVDLLTISGHKIHAPQGRGRPVHPQGAALPAPHPGGGQEEGPALGHRGHRPDRRLCRRRSGGQGTLSADLEHMAALKEDLARRLPRRSPALRWSSRDRPPHILPITLPRL